MAQTIKNRKNELVTRGILEEVLRPYVTKKDLAEAFAEQNKRNFKVFATKQDLKEGFDNFRQEMHGEFNKNQAYLEKIVAKLEKKEQEDTIHSYQHKSAEDRLANHDKRLEKLEKATSPVV